MSSGGQTSIYFYFGSTGTGFNSAICKTALNNLTDGTSMSGPDKQTVLDCIGASGGTADLSGKKKQIFNQSLQECWQYNNEQPAGDPGERYLIPVSPISAPMSTMPRDSDHGPLAFNPASDIKVGDAGPALQRQLRRRLLQRLPRSVASLSPRLRPGRSISSCRSRRSRYRRQPAISSSVPPPIR